MNIVYACDDNYAEMMGISMVSLFENNKKCYELTVYVLDDEISSANKSKLKSLAIKYRRNVMFIDVNKLPVPEDMLTTRCNKSTVIRICMCEFLPKTDRVLYLDCDLLVLDSLENLYNTDISHCSAAGVLDCLSEGYRTNIGLSPNDAYINSGVLLVNMQKWNKTELLDFYSSKSKVIRYSEQDTINGVFSHSVKVISPRYNCYTALFDFSYNNLMKYRKPSVYYSKEEIVEAAQNPAIIHFSESFLSLRPWIKGSKHPYATEWLIYKAMTPWANEPLRENTASGKSKVYASLYGILPRKLSIGVAGLLHARIVPWMRKRQGLSMKQVVV